MLGYVWQKQSRTVTINSKLQNHIARFESKLGPTMPSTNNVAKPFHSCKQSKTWQWSDREQETLKVCARLFAASWRKVRQKANLTAVDQNNFNDDWMNSSRSWPRTRTRTKKRIQMPERETREHPWSKIGGKTLKEFNAKIEQKSESAARRGSVPSIEGRIGRCDLSLLLRVLKRDFIIGFGSAVKTAMTRTRQLFSRTNGFHWSPNETSLWPNREEILCRRSWYMGRRSSNSQVGW